MKVLVFPDIHGSWVNALSYIKANKDSVDFVVTLGDYVDDWDNEVNGEPMIEGFTELCKLARAEPDKFRICIGNHDLSYFSNSREGACCSGHHDEYAAQYRKMFEDNIDLLNAVVEIDGVLFSHAGVSQFWYNSLTTKVNANHRYDKVPKKLVKEMNILWKDANDFSEKTKNVYDCEYSVEYGRLVEVAQQATKACDDWLIEHRKADYLSMNLKTSLNKLNKEVRKYPELLDHCGWSSSGDSAGESCVWIRPYALLDDNWPNGYKCQVVGHTECGLKFMKRKHHKLIVCDNREHDCPFVLDTEKIDELNFEQVKFEKRRFSDNEMRLLALLQGGLF